MEPPTRGHNQTCLDELDSAIMSIYEQDREDTETRLKDLYKDLHPTDHSLSNYELFMQAQIMEPSEQVLSKLPENCVENLQLLSYRAIVCLVYVLVRYFGILIEENASKFRKSILQDIVHFFTFHWANLNNAIQKRSDDEKQLALMLWHEAFFTNSFEIPSAINWMINERKHYPEQALHCYHILGLIKDPNDNKEFIAWHKNWDSVVTDNLFKDVYGESEQKPIVNQNKSESEQSMYGKYKYVKKAPNEFAESIRMNMGALGGFEPMYELRRNEKKEPDEFAELIRLDIPTHSGSKSILERYKNVKKDLSGSIEPSQLDACISNSITTITDYKPDVKRVKLRTRTSSSNWNSVSTLQQGTILIDNFRNVPTKLYFEDYMGVLIVPFFEQTKNWNDMNYYIKLVISGNNNSSNLVMFNSYPYPTNLGATPCYVFNWSSSVCTNPYSFTCASNNCNVNIQLFLNNNEIRLHTSDQYRRHLKSCVKNLDVILRYDMRREAIDVLRSMNPQTEIKTLNVELTRQFEQLLQVSIKFLTSKSILESVKNLKRNNSDDQYIRRNSRDFIAGLQTIPLEKTSFRIHIEELAYSNQEAGSSNSSS
uniref:Uncharacterized protein n=1 Tax=Acrobeloides nanus TaxID=290746 RepID=A0A914CB69_9BILA